MALSLEDAALFLPQNLSPAGRRQLFEELSRLPETHSYYGNNPHEALLQGDAWANVDFLDVGSGEARQIKVVVLSNTCDVAPENARDVPIRLVVSPLVRLSRLVTLLKSHGVSDATVDDKLAVIRKQEVSNIFYFPKHDGVIDDEYILFFDEVQSQLPKKFFGNAAKHRLFSLSQVGFWYLLAKLSIHFCRATEGVLRQPGPSAARG